MLSTILLTVVLQVLPLAAQTPDSVPVLRPMASLFMVNAGHASLLDTYLTPITYKGMNVGVAYSATRAMGFSPSRWVWQLSLGADYSSVDNLVGDNTMHSLMIEGQWGMMRRWNEVWTPRLQFMAGGMTRLQGGVIYNAANSNNVVSVKAHWSMGIMGMTVYNTRMWRVPVTLSYQVALPVLGVFFSPEFDESYYEMYLGNRRGLANFGWWGNRFDMINLVAADMHFGNTILRLGYRNRFERSYVNNLNTHITTHAFVIGLGGDFLSVSGRGISPQAKIISSMY